MFGEKQSLLMSHAWLTTPLLILSQAEQSKSMQLLIKAKLHKLEADVSLMRDMSIEKDIIHWFRHDEKPQVFKTGIKILCKDPFQSSSDLMCCQN